MCKEYFYIYIKLYYKIGSVYVFDEIKVKKYVYLKINFEMSL